MFITLIAGTVIIFAVMAIRLRHVTARRCVTDRRVFLQHAKDIIGSWKGEARHKARMNMCWDYLFIPFYSTLAAMTCFAIARHRVGWLA